MNRITETVYPLQCAGMFQIKKRIFSKWQKKKNLSENFMISHSITGAAVYLACILTVGRRAGKFAVMKWIVIAAGGSLCWCRGDYFRLRSTRPIHLLLLLFLSQHFFICGWSWQFVYTRALGYFQRLFCSGLFIMTKATNICYIRWGHRGGKSEFFFIYTIAVVKCNGHQVVLKTLASLMGASLIAPQRSTVPC